jgi:hypothetical protein
MGTICQPKKSIMTPNVFVVPGYGAGIMYPNYAEKLTLEQLNALAACVLSL